MAISDEITRLQQAKAALKTSIEGKGVTVSSDATLDDYPALVDSIEAGGGGGSVPYITNPLNGTIFGGSDRGGGTYTHQYQLSSGNVVDAYLAKNSFNRYSDPTTARESDELVDENEHIKSISSSYFPSRLEINNSGLLTLTLESAEYEWRPENRPIIFVILISDEGYTFIDDFDVYCYYPCFVKGTKITLANGESINVEDVDYNHSLLVWDFDNGQKSSAYPLWVSKSLIADHYKLITLDDGKQMKLVGTGENCHRLFCIEDGQFVYANKMVGKTTIYQDGTHHKVVNCEIVSEKVEYYNIITNYHINLYADDVLTSCRYNNIYPIEDMRYIKDGRPIRKQCEYNVAEKYYTGLRLGEQKIDVNSTLKYINNLISLDVQTASS